MRGKTTLGIETIENMQGFSSESETNVHIAILMAVYNGAPYLQEQLDSIAAQEHGNWQLLASDDASRDQSVTILKEFSQKFPVTVLEGPAQGAADNFLSLLRRAPDHVPEGSWLAFSDQDDVWLADRLSRGIAALKAVDPAKPALYCSRTWITDADLKQRQLSAPRPRPVVFRNALVQNVAAGNTILLNPEAARLLFSAANEINQFVMHDWWAYQMVSGAGGVVIHDDAPTLLYRQHDKNHIGSNDNTTAQLHRIKRLISGDFRVWNSTNILALQASMARLTPQHRSEFQRFTAIRNHTLLRRLLAMRHAHVYRQSFTGTLALWVAACLNRI